MENRRVFFIAQVCPIGKGIHRSIPYSFGDGIETLKTTTCSEYLVGYTPPKYILGLKFNHYNLYGSLSTNHCNLGGGFN